VSETEIRQRPKTSEHGGAWRNKWRSVHDVGGCPLCGFYVPVGDVYMEGCRLPFATKAEAEADAVHDIVAQIHFYGRLTDEWLGAFEEGGG
jgi:hypothetical protein